MGSEMRYTAAEPTLIPEPFRFCEQRAL